MTENEAKIPVEGAAELVQKPVHEVQNAYIRMYLSQVADLNAILQAAEVPTPKPYTEPEAQADGENSEAPEAESEAEPKSRRRK